MCPSYYSIQYGTTVAKKRYSNFLIHEYQEQYASLISAVGSTINVSRGWFRCLDRVTFNTDNNTKCICDPKLFHPMMYYINVLCFGVTWYFFKVIDSNIL